jgi:hypothetical protein
MALQGPDERGKRWLQAKVQEILTANAITLAPSRAEGTPSAYWGTDLETGTTLYLRLAGTPEPTALRFGSTLLYDCGAGRYRSQERATIFIRRTLKKMGILPG